ncbi:MAG: hypothetical protein QOE61_4070 [Micromonosporaceae bacterium]|jgi:hypothetical protein|nr:hypothetical protein [Micromonosporaceae bacterium]
MSVVDPAASLSPKQLGALIILMAEAREVSNNDLDEIAKFRLVGDEWKTLVDRGLIDMHKVGRGLAFQLTEKGWRFCKQLHEAKVNVGNSTAARSIFVLLGGLHRSLDRLRVSHADFFKQSTKTPREDAVEPSSGDVESRIRSIYADLVSEPGQWLGLADLRDHLSGLDPSAVNDTLRAMAQMQGVRIIPVENSRALEHRDQEAALRMGGEDHHALAIDPA